MAPGPILNRLKADTINKELIDTIEGFIKQNHTQALAKSFVELQPADAADVIEHLAPDERLFIFNLLTSEGAGDVLIEIEPPVQKQGVRLILRFKFWKMPVNEELPELLPSITQDKGAKRQNRLAAVECPSHA